MPSDKLDRMNPMTDQDWQQVYVDCGATAKELSKISAGIWVLFAVSVGFLIYWAPVTERAWVNSTALGRWVPFGIFLYVFLCSLFLFIEGLLLGNYVVRIFFFEDGLQCFELANGKRIEVKSGVLTTFTFIVYAIRANELAGQRCLVLWPHLICVPETM